MDHMEERWLPIVKEQEKKLRFQQFGRKEAWTLGQKAVELIEGRYQNYGQGIAMWVILDDTLVFSHLMESTNIENNWWMQKKLNTVKKTGVSSLRSMLEVEYGQRERESWCAQTGQYALCGGCIPIWLENGSVAGYAIVSNLPHECDHQLLADAMAEVLGIKIPSLLD